MDFGISTACFYPRPTEITAKELAERGIPHCELFINTISELEPAFIRKIAGVFRDGGTKVLSLHPFTCAFEPFMLFTDYARRFQDALEWHKYYFDAMNILDAKIFVFHGDRAAGNLPAEEYFERFARLRDMGKAFGVTVAQENVERCRSRSVDFLEQMAEYLDHDISLVFDNKQALRSGVSAADFLNRLGKYIVHVHISDHNGTDDCAPIASDSPAIRELLASLREIGFSKAVFVELYGEYLSNLEEVYNSYTHLLQLANV